MDTVVIRPYNRKSFGWFCLGLFFTATFTYVLVTAGSEQHVRMAQGMILLFGLPTLLFAVFLLPGSSVVKVDANGIECRMFWIRAFRLTWPDMERVTSVDFPSTWGVPRIGFAYISLSAIGREKMKHSFFQKVTRGKLGINKGIPDMYGPVKELARVLNEKKSQFERNVNRGIKASHSG
jgi:hypothetical protein